MSITIVGLGPAGLDLVDSPTRRLLEDPEATVILRTDRHPASVDVASLREVTVCDDLYESHAEFADVYGAIVERVMAAASSTDVIYAVPGSPMVGERTVGAIVAAAGERGIDVSVQPATSFLDLALASARIDPISDGLQVVDARQLPDPLPLHLPTIITQVDSPLRAADLAVALGRTLDDDTEVLVMDRLGDADEVVRWVGLDDLATYDAGPRTSVMVPATDVGLLGLIATNRLLRAECPWDGEQTHHTLLAHLVEEAYETADALGRLSVEAPGGEVDFGAYAEVEDELGDLLLQVLFHSTLASEAGAFDIDEVAEMNRRKLVRRHPHVFGDVEVSGASDVLSNWEQIKQEERSRASLMDDVPTGMPPIARALKVQKRAAGASFDWDAAEPVFEVLDEEIRELREALGDREAVTDEIGDVLFTVINLSRHLDVDADTALRRSVDRFMERFRVVEAAFATQGRSIADASLEELEAAWHTAKATTMGPTQTPAESP
jgi:tetrapyrrole methylase family protein/MazG family protein